MLPDYRCYQVFRLGRLFVGKLRFVGIQILGELEIEIGVEGEIVLTFLPAFGLDGLEF